MDTVVQQAPMGIIAFKNQSVVSKALIVLLLIVLSPVLIVVVLLYVLWGATLYLAIWLTRRKQFVIFVYSNSPTWKEYMEREILPQKPNHAVILNWSERRNWKNSLAVLAFKYFGGHKNFNPMAIVFPPFRLVKTYRFFEAFQEFKHGDDKKVQEMKEELLKMLDVQEQQR